MGFGNNVPPTKIITNDNPIPAAARFLEPSLIVFNGLKRAKSDTKNNAIAQVILEAERATLDVLAGVRAARGTPLPRLLGVLPTNVAREARQAELLDLLGRSYGQQLLEPVPRRAVVRQAEGAHAPVRAFGAAGKDVADVYSRVAAHVLDAAGVTPTTEEVR